MKVIKTLLNTFIILSNFVAFGQKDYALEIMDTLCSPYYDGRGYVNNGDVRSGDFIIDELKSIGVEHFKKNSYEQFYSLNVNTFPYDIHVVLGKDTLNPGIEYLVDPRSGTAQGDFQVVEVNSNNIITNYGGTINFALEEKGQKIYAFNFTDITDKEKFEEIHQLAIKAMKYYPAIWVTNNKQMYSVGREQNNYPLINIDSASYKQVETISLKINNKYIPKYESKNVIGVIPGKKKKKYVVFSAHYDHLGRMGTNTYFPGANDNASGVAMLLSLARHYINYPPEYSMVFCFFSGEEAGLVGSRYFVNNPFLKLKKVQFVLNIDIMGGAEDGITIVNGTKHEEAFNNLAEINTEKNYLTQIKKRGPTANSDHYFFSESGVPAFFIYSMGTVKNYHDVFDTSENTPLGKFDEVQQLLIDFVEGL